MNVVASSSSPLPPSPPAAAAAGCHDASTPSTTVFVPPPLPSFLATPCRPGFQTPTSRHPACSSQLPPPPPRPPKFRRFTWSKIPASRVHGRHNVWSTSDRLYRDVKLDFERIEELFTVPSSPAPLSPSSSSTGLKYPASSAVSAASGPQDPASRPASSACATSQPRTQSSEVSCILCFHSD